MSKDVKYIAKGKIIDILKQYQIGDIIGSITEIFFDFIQKKGIRVCKFSSYDRKM